MKDLGTVFGIQQTSYLFWAQVESRWHWLGYLLRLLFVEALFTPASYGLRGWLLKAMFLFCESVFLIPLSLLKFGTR